MTLVYFGVDCRPWNTTLFAVPWQLNPFHVMLINNLLAGARTSPPARSDTVEQEQSQAERYREGRSPDEGRLNEVTADQIEEDLGGFALERR